MTYDTSIINTCILILAKMVHFLGNSCMCLYCFIRCAVAGYPPSQYPYPPNQPGYPPVGPAQPGYPAQPAPYPGQSTTILQLDSARKVKGEMQMLTSKLEFNRFSAGACRALRLKKSRCPVQNSGAQMYIGART